MTVSGQQPNTPGGSDATDPWLLGDTSESPDEPAPQIVEPDVPPSGSRPVGDRSAGSLIDQLLTRRWVQIAIAVIWWVFAAAVVSVPLSLIVDSRRLAAFLAFIVVGVAAGGVLAYRSYRTLVDDEARKDQEQIRAQVMAESTAMTADQAELCAAAWMRRLGYADATTTGAGRDGGVDVNSSLAIAQVKATAKAVGRPVIQQTYGVANADGKAAVVFSLSGYSYEAIRWSDRHGVALFDFDGQCRATPRSASARNLWSTMDWDNPDA